MMNYYKRSLKEFKKYIKRNPYCTREEWDNYAHKNCFFSAFTLESHTFYEKDLKLMQREKQDIFRELKEMYIIIPPKDLKILGRIVKLNKNNKVGETDDRQF